jgi:ectoine hydroxylase-related dioxygenase (phytanoyl-CoA dioxygenase family)
MNASLAAQDVERFHQDGVIGAFPALSHEEVTHLRGRLEAFETRMGESLGNLPGQVRAKTHLLFPWMNQLVRNPRILDAVESILGKNLLVYHVTCWLKDPGDGTFVTWHQDGAYFNLEPAEHITAWVALSEATEQSGCMRFIPGSHSTGALAHEKGQTDNNLLSNGQQVAGIDGAGAIAVPVPAGHFSLHHTHILHASSPNNSSDRRIGIGISYIPTHVQFSGNTRVTATQVRGVDEYKYFDAEAAPSSEYDEQARRHHAEAINRFFAAHGSTRAANA